jgi:hypothetical protein
MAKGMLIVTARPESPETLDAFNRWYDETHIPEMVALPGIASAQRYRALDGESYVTVYEADDIDEAKAGMAASQQSGSMTRPVGVQLDPPPTVQWWEKLAAD